MKRPWSSAGSTSGRRCRSSSRDILFRNPYSSPPGAHGDIQEQKVHSNGSKRGRVVYTAWGRKAKMEISFTQAAPQFVAGPVWS